MALLTSVSTVASVRDEAGEHGAMVVPVGLVQSPMVDCKRAYCTRCFVDCHFRASASQPGLMVLVPIALVLGKVAVVAAALVPQVWACIWKCSHGGSHNAVHNHVDARFYP